MRAQWHCSHGKPMSRTVQCQDCDRVWHNLMIRNHEKNLAYHRQQLALLDGEKEKGHVE